MTEEQRVELEEKVMEYLRKEWGEEYREEDTIRISDFCQDEVDNVMDLSYPFTDNDIYVVAMEFEMRYG